MALMKFLNLFNAGVARNMRKKCFSRKTFFALVLVFLALAVVFLPQSFAGDEETELFLIAQNAFNDGFYDVAIRYTSQFLDHYPQSTKYVQANLLLGQCYFFKNQYLKAFEIFQRLEQFSEAKDATLFWLGETYLKGSDYASAQKYYQQVIDLFPYSIYAPQAYYSLGWSYFDQKNHEKALDVFLQFTVKFPAHDLAEDSLFKMAECEYHLRSYQNVISRFADILAKFPRSRRKDQAYFYTAESYFYLDDFPKAVENYIKTTQFSTDANVILAAKISIGWCYFKLKDFENSKKFFDDAQAFSQEKNIPSDDIDLGRASLWVEMTDYPKALEAYDHLITTFPDSTRVAEAYLGKANALYQLKNYPEATTYYQKVIDTFSQNPMSQEIVEKAKFGLAWTYLKNNSTAQAIEIFQNIAGQTQNVSSKISALVQTGDTFQDINELEKALETYDKILRDSPDSFYADYVQYRQGIALLKLNRFEAAILSFQTLNKNFPNSKYLPDTTYYLGLTYFRKGDWAAAQEQLTQFAANLPANSEFAGDAQYILGLCLFNSQDFDGASKIFQKIIKNYPQETTLVSNCEMNIAKCLYHLGDAKEAVKRFKIIVYKYPKTDAEMEALLWLGDFYLQSSDFNNTVSYYQQLIENFPSSERINVAHFGLGQAYQEQGALDKAIYEYKLIGEAFDHELYTKAQLSIADILTRDIDPDVAIETYRKITASAPEFSRDAQLKIAEAYKKNYEYENSLKAFDEALKSSQGASKITSAEVQFLIADTYETTKKFKEAVDAYLKIPYLYPQETPWAIKAYLRSARIFEKEDDWENAKSAYTKIISYKTDEAKFAQERLEWIGANIPTQTE